MLTVLDAQEPARAARWCATRAATLSAVNERRGQLRELIGNANDSFGALASRNESLAEAVFIFPTFLDESRCHASRGSRPSRATPARWCATSSPVARDLRADAPRRGQAGAGPEGAVPRPRPADRRVAEDAAVGRAVHPRRRAAVRGACTPTFDELNPILSYLNFQQQQVADFITNGGGSLNSMLPPLNAQEGPRHYLRAYSAINSRGVGIAAHPRPSYDRGNSYPAPNYLRRARPLGMTEAFDCKPAGGEQKDPDAGEPPCFVAPKSLWDGGLYPTVGRGEAPVRSNPPGSLGSEPATP